MKWIFFCLFVFLAFGIKAQENMYKYIYDKDGFVNVREKPNGSSSVIDTFYHLQVVSINSSESSGDWVLVMNCDKAGYIHKSRLVSLPETTVNYLSQKEPGCFTFIASVDCPNVLVYCERMQPLKKKQGNHILEFVVEEHTVKDINKGLLDYRHVIDPISYIGITEGRLVFYDNSHQYFYTFYRNRNGKECMNLVSFRDYKSQNLQRNESIIKKFREQVVLLKEDKDNRNEIRVNDFDFLDSVSQMYYAGIPEVQEDYYFFLYNFPLDGEGSHAIETYFSDLWGYLNRGETAIDKIVTLTLQNWINQGND